MLKSLKLKMIIPTMIIILITVLVPVQYLITQMQKSFRERSEDNVMIAVNVLNLGINNLMMSNDKKNINSIINNLTSDKNFNEIRLFRNDQIITHSSIESEIGKHLEAVDSNHLSMILDTLTEAKIILDELTNRYSVIEPIYNENICQKCHDENRIISFIDIETNLYESEVNFLTGSKHILFLGVLFLILMGFGYYFLFKKIIDDPLKKLLFGIAQIEKGKFSFRFNGKSNDEFDIVNTQFNNMIDTIENSKQKIEDLTFDRLRHADKLITVGELTAEMAHEVNNHIAIIMARADYLYLQSMNNNNLDIIRSDLQVINNQIKNISTITRNILRHSKLPEASFKDVNLEVVINECKNFVKHILTKNNAKLKIEIEKGNYIVNGDSNLLEQALNNIVLNSIDAVEDNGTITIKMKMEGDEIILSVIDDGEGIESNDLDNIFSPFFTTKALDKGTGLGLYIVWNIIKKHYAKINCTSTKNVGSEFKITFHKMDEE